MAESHESIQEIALKLMIDQNRNGVLLDGQSERTLFVLGSKGVGKSTLINQFLDKNVPITPTLGLEYSFTKRVNSGGQSNQKLIGNIWELGSLANSNHLIDIPLRLQKLEYFSAIIILNLANPGELLKDLELSIQGLKQSITKIFSAEDILEFKEKIAQQASFRDHTDNKSLEIMPCHTVIIGGMYDKFENLEPEVKKHIVRFLRSMNHILGSTLMFHSNKIPTFQKPIREVFNHLCFGSPQNPIRSHKTDQNDQVTISNFSDSWEDIGIAPSNSERTAIAYSTQIQQDLTKTDEQKMDPTTNQKFRELVIEELRSIKDEELLRLIRNSEIRSKLDSFGLTNSPFCYT